MDSSLQKLSNNKNDIPVRNFCETEQADRNIYDNNCPAYSMVFSSVMIDARC